MAREGKKRTAYELQAGEVGLSLRNVSAKVQKASRGASGNGGQRQGDGDPRASEPAAAPGGYSGEPPF